MNTTRRTRRMSLAGAAACSLCAPAQGQTYFGSLTWEANDGTGWTAGRLVTSADSVRVRILAGWTPPNPEFYFAGCQFDVAVTAGDGHNDVVTDAARTPATRRSSAQTIVATRFGNTIKIDDARDTLPPGQGTRGVFPGQLVEGFDPQDHSNPLDLLEFTLTFDGIAGSRTVNSLYVAPSGGNTIDHVMRIYTTFSGQNINPSTTTFPLEIVYVPGPGPVVVAGLGLLAAGARRRRS